MKHIYINSGSAISPVNSFDEQKVNWYVPAQESARFTCVEPNYREILPVRLLRRMSRPVKMALTATKKALQEIQIETPDAVIVGTGLGMVDDTEKFLLQMLENKEQLLNPTAFIQSTHNTVGGQIALMLKCNGHNMTYVHASTSFEAALLDARLYLQENPDHTILVGGVEEMTEENFTLRKRVDEWRKDAQDSDVLLTFKTQGVTAGEGAAFFTLSTQKRAGSVEVVANQVVKDGKIEEQELVHGFLNSVGLKFSDIDILLLGLNGDVENDRQYESLIQNNTGMCIGAYQHLCGTYDTSSSFGCWLAYRLITTQDVPKEVVHKGNAPSQLKRVLVYNKEKRDHNHGLTLLQQC